jgi:hypothetical protein
MAFVRGGDGSTAAIHGGIMKRLVYMALVISIFTGCATLDIDSPIANGDPAEPVLTLREAIIDGILVAHPVLNRGEANDLAMDFYRENREALDREWNRAQSWVSLVRFIASLLYNQGGEVNN